MTKPFWLHSLTWHHHINLKNGRVGKPGLDFIMRTTLFIAIVCIVISCNNKGNITDPADYAIYLQDDFIKEKSSKTKQEMNFWYNRLEQDSGSYINMLELARYRLEFHQLTGQVDYLNMADSLLQNSSVKLNHTDAELLYSLTQSSIARHQFPKAAAYCKMAAEAGGDKHILHQLQFDTYMELGDYKNAGRSLQNISDRSSFDYLIRKAKWEDKQGDLDAAIDWMELALKCIDKKSKNLKVWTLSNLGDMYGHAGRIKDAYKAYLEVLKIDPANLYCLKGIAWIAFSHDGNTEEARGILEFIISHHESPDFKLILADIAEAENNSNEKMSWINKFIKQTTDNRYGNMYSKNLVMVLSEEFQKHDNALVIAEKELSNRFTPETCDWMAWIKYRQGRNKEALSLVEKYVFGYNHEPEALMHVAYIFEANGKIGDARRLFSECLKSSFELGPVLTQKIKEKLKEI